MYFKRRMYSNESDDTMVILTYEEFYEYIYHKKFIDKNRMQPLYQGCIYSTEEEEQLLFFDYNKVEGLLLGIQNAPSDSPELEAVFLEGLAKDNIYTYEKEYVSVDFNYYNKKVHEELELGDEITVQIKEPPTYKERSLLTLVKDNPFFKAFDLSGMKYAETVDGEKGLCIENIFFDIDTVEFYLIKYPKEESLKHRDPKEDCKVIDPNFLKRMNAEKESLLIF